MIGSSTTKAGEFDWIVDYNEIQDFINRCISDMKIKKTATVTDSFRAMVIGCGTSPLAEKFCEAYIVENEYFNEAVACDIDLECIEHMKKMFKGSKVSYIVHDLMDDSYNLDGYLRASSYYLLLDKGTLDAILVEGTIGPLVREIIRLLEVGGRYLVFSIHTPDLLNRLLHIPEWGLSCVFFESISEEYCYSVASFEKTSYSFDMEKFTAHEKSVMDDFYKLEHPFLTEDYKKSILTAFSDMALDFKEAYNVMFSKDDLLGYDYHLFLEDIENFPLSQPGKITAEEAIDFIKSVQ